MLVMLTSTGRIKDVLCMSRVLVESCLGSCFSYLGFQRGILMIEMEEEKGVSSGSLLLVFTLSM